MAKLIKCKACGNDVAKSAKTCPNCGQRLKIGIFKKIILTIFALVVIIIIISMFAGQGTDTKTSAVVPSATSNTAPETSNNQSSSAEEPAIDPRPADQIAIVDVLLKAQESARNSENNMQRGAALASRGAELCNLFNSNKTVSDWVGEVKAVDANSDGKGVFTVLLAKNIQAGTWNNAFSDISHNTLIEPADPLFAAVSQLKRGDIVKFSGEFFTDQQHCLTSSNMSLSGKVESPDFIFKFSKVEKMQ